MHHIVNCESHCTSQCELCIDEYCSLNQSKGTSRFKINIGKFITIEKLITNLTEEYDTKIRLLNLVHDTMESNEYTTVNHAIHHLTYTLNDSQLNLNETQYSKLCKDVQYMESSLTFYNVYNCTDVLNKIGKYEQAYEFFMMCTEVKNTEIDLTFDINLYTNEQTYKNINSHPDNIIYFNDEYKYQLIHNCVLVYILYFMFTKYCWRDNIMYKLAKHVKKQILE